MPDPDDLIAALQAQHTALQTALGADSTAFFAEQDRLISAMADATTTAEQDTVTTGLLALAAQYPAAQTLLAQAAPDLFPATTPVPVTAPPTETPVAVSVNGAGGGPAPPDPVATVVTTQALRVAAEPIGAGGGGGLVATSGGVGADPPLLHQQPANPAGTLAVPSTTSSPAKESPMATTNTPPPVPADKPAAPTETAGIMADGWNNTRYKEQVAGRLAGLVVGGTVVLAAITIFAVLFNISTANVENAKNILLILSPLCGVVLGYYFGRIPSEAQAQQAQARADQAEGESARAKQEAQAITSEAADLAGAAMGEAGGLGGEEGATRSGGYPPRPAPNPEWQRRLRDLQRRADRL
jgi:hypothetical protein